MSPRQEGIMFNNQVRIREYDAKGNIVVDFLQYYASIEEAYDWVNYHIEYNADMRYNLERTKSVNYYVNGKLYHSLKIGK